MHSRKIMELQAAIKAGESAHLYSAELEQARRALDMERKAAARARLREAERARNVERWYAAVRDGERVGLDRTLLADSMRQLTAEEGRVAARAKLRQAARRGGDAQDLREALALGEKLGVEGEELGRAREALATLEEKLVMQHALGEAVLSRDIAKLEAAIDQGLTMHLDYSPELLDAQRTLREEKAQIAARTELKDACLRKAPEEAGQLEALRVAIAAGEAAGLEAGELAAAKEALALDERLATARELLRRATESRKLADLEAAIAQGEVAGLEAPELEPARRLRAEAFKPAARERLKAAVASRDVEEILAAIQHGEQVGLSKIAFTEAWEAVAAEERKAKARAGLREAGRTREIGKLFTAVRFGEGAGLDELELAPFREVLAVEERRAAARERLEAAVARVEARPLRSAVEEGRAVGLEPRELAGGRWGLIEALELDAARSLEIAAEQRKIEELELTIAEAEAAKLEIEQLLALVEGSPRGSEMSRWLAEAKGVLAVEKRKVAARLLVKEAERSRDLADLRAANREGEEAGLTYVDLRSLQALLADEERRVPARQRLQEALRGDSIETLRHAIRNGDRAKLSRAELREAREVLEAMERRAMARSGLEAAAAGSPRGLQAALGEGRAAGLRSEELAPFEERLAVERGRLAREKLAEAERSLGVGALQEAVRQAERAGLREAECRRARELLAEERLRAATGSGAVTALRCAISEGERRVPASGELPPARDSLTVAERQEAARAALREAVQGSDAGQLSNAIKHGRAAGLEEWEVAEARGVLRDVRRVLAGGGEARCALLVPTSGEHAREKSERGQ